MTTSLAQSVVVGEFPKEDTIHNFPWAANRSEGLGYYAVRLSIEHSGIACMESVKPLLQISYNQ